MATAIEAGPRPWISVNEGARRLRIGPDRMQRLVELELVETLKLPRQRPLVSAEDLERLRRESHKPARPASPRKNAAKVEAGA
jgi:hypothetical protein